MALIVSLAVLLLPLAGLVAFGMASLRWGVDSREDHPTPAALIDPSDSTDRRLDVADRSI